MKKTILNLLLVLFVTLVTTATFGQFIPRPIECIDLDDPLNVVPGQPYTYKVNVPTPNGAKTYHWFVTQSVNMITSGSLNVVVEPIPGEFLASGSGHYNNPLSAVDTISLTWQSFTLDPTEYLFVGIMVENTDPNSGCTTNNLKIYRIQPLHAFSLDLANVDPLGNIQPDYGQDNFTQCISDIMSASYDAVNDEIDYDFGADTLYYAVAAANFSGSFQLRVQLAGLTSSQSVGITWGYTFATVDDYEIAPVGSPNGTYTSGTNVAAPGGNVGPAGMIFYIRMIIDHSNQFEGIATSQYTFGINGNLVDALGAIIPGAADVHHVTPCPQADFDDIALQSLSPRPNVNSVSPPPPGFLPIGN